MALANDDEDIAFSTDDEWDADDESLDFEHLTPEDGAYEITFRTVIFSRDERQDGDGFNMALRIQVQLSTDDEFNGMQLSNYIWLGRDGTFTPAGRRQLKAMAEAAGLEVRDQMRMSDFGATPGNVGKVHGKLLSAFNGRHAGAEIKTTEEVIGGEERLVCKPTGFYTLAKLAEVQQTKADADF
jgi:hypothetical protein